jgi:protein SCO1/2
MVSIKMSDQHRRLLYPLLAFMVGLVVLGVVWFAFDPAGSGNSSAIGGPFQLSAQDGRAVTEKELLGQPSLVFFGYTHCPDVCPTALYEIGLIYQALGKDGDRLKSFFITVDPERDTAAVMKDYLSAFDPRIMGLSGTSEAVTEAEKAYRAFAKKVPLETGGYTMDHTAIIYLMDGRGRFVSSLNVERPPEENAKLIARYF